MLAANGRFCYLTGVTLTKRRLGIAAALLLFAALVTVQVVNTGRTKLPPPITLPDGSKLRVVRVSFSKEHPAPGKWWYPLARRLPAAWHARLRLNPGAVMTSLQPTLGIWCVWEHPGVAATSWDLGLMDEEGNEAGVGNYRSFTSDEAGELSYRGWTFEAFPRRGATLKLRFYVQNPQGKQVLGGSFHVQNPVRGNFPVWRPQPLPVVVTRGDLKITFNRLVVGVDLLAPFSQFEGNITSAARVDFQLAGPGKSADYLSLDRIDVADATGNAVVPNMFMQDRVDDRRWMTFNSHLWASESAWKVRVEFMRNEKAVFTTNELIIVNGLALPTTDGRTELNLATNRLGHTVRVLGLTRETFQNRPAGLAGADVRLEVEVTPALSDKRLTVVSMRDDQGRTCEMVGPAYFSGFYAFGFNPEPDAKSLDITLAVQEVVSAEFLMKPELFDLANEMTK